MSSPNMFTVPSAFSIYQNQLRDLESRTQQTRSQGAWTSASRIRVRIDSPSGEAFTKEEGKPNLQLQKN